MMLEPVESMSLTIAKAQLERGEPVTPNIAALLIWALARITDDEQARRDRAVKAEP